MQTSSCQTICPAMVFPGVLRKTHAELEGQAAFKKVTGIVIAYNCPMQGKSGLPELLRPFFWDYEFSKLSLGKDRDLIIRRILSHGSWNAVRWLRKQLGDRELREWLISQRGRGLTPRQLRFWGLLYDLPTREVNQWVKTAQGGVWDNR